MSTPGAGHGSKFSRKKEEAIQALCTQRSVEEAARVAGISKATLIRWMKLPEFRSAYRAARREAVAQSDARLQQACTAAATTLVKIMLDAAAPASARVRAARHVLDGAHQAIQFEDFESRLAAVERAAEEMNSHRS